MAKKKGLPSQSKAKTILEDGTVRGNPLSTKQKGLFGMIAGGKTPMKQSKQGPSKPSPLGETSRPIGDTGSSAKYAKMKSGRK